MLEAFLNKQGNFQINNQTLLLEALEKEQTKLKNTRRK